ncbi:MAG: hypothetical protein D3906_15265, partial [Candidatus Electrothrix sp. AUS1_2]|nr:hypothetical protein [Candidatus Electrothrix sp. AUS1_2]
MGKISAGSQALSSNQEILVALKKARTKIEQLEHGDIAIVGMGCRFPGGANNIEQFWQLLRQGREAVTDIPPSRWPVDEYYDPAPGTPDKMYMKQAHLLQHPIEEFDPQFFGIAPLEAQNLDAQHRLLLEVTWEA